MSLVKRISKAPIKLVNIVAGGNAIDKLKEHNNPLLRRAVKTLSSDSKIMKRMVNRYGSEAERQAFNKERVKTHAGRIVTLVGGSTTLLHERNKKKGPYYAY